MGITEENFKKYNSIENTYREVFVNKIFSQYPSANHMKWAITEKIHGTNIQISYDGKDTLIGGRTHVIESDEKYYNIQTIASQYFYNVQQLFITIKDTLNENIEKVIVFGELFGGSYPCKEIERDNNATRVQKGVWYCPHNDIIFFDIHCVYKDGSGQYLPVITFEDLMEKVRLPFQKSIVVNSLEEALKYPNDELSEVYKRYNLPALEDNIREGVVIKPYLEDLWLGQSRVILKNKNERFAEKTHEKKVNLDVTLNYSEQLKKALVEVEPYCTENRMRNVISHIGEVTLQDIGKVIGMTNKDVLDDFNKETGLLNTIEKAEQKIVSKHVNFLISKIVKSTLLREL